MEGMIEIITPSATIGWIKWDFLNKSINNKDKLVLESIQNMIGFRTGNNSYYIGEFTDDKKLQYYHDGAYETRSIETDAILFYERSELIEKLKEEYEKVTNNKLNIC